MASSLIAPRHHTAARYVRALGIAPPKARARGRGRLNAPRRASASDVERNCRGTPVHFSTTSATCRSVTCGAGAQQGIEPLSPCPAPASRPQQPPPPPQRARLPLGRPRELQERPGLVEEVNRLVREEPVVDVADRVPDGHGRTRRTLPSAAPPRFCFFSMASRARRPRRAARRRALDGGVEGVRLVGHPVVLLVLRAEALEDRARALGGGLVDRHRLEAALERGVLLSAVQSSEDKCGGAAVFRESGLGGGGRCAREETEGGRAASGLCRAQRTCACGTLTWWWRRRSGCPPGRARA